MLFDCLLAAVGAALVAVATPFSAFLGVLTWCGLRAARDTPPASFAEPVTASGPRRFLVVVPAHNETAVIEGTLKSLAALAWPPALRRILVIADNCSDDTATKARANCAEVFERVDAFRRGKGYALEDVLGSVMVDPRFAEVDAVVIVDADSWADAHLLAAFDRALSAGADFLQCYDAVRNRDDSWRTRLLAYAFALFNGTYQWGLHAAGLGAHLRGNGMCFSRRGLERHPWKAAGLAEDIEFSWRLRLAGERIGFVSDGAVHAEMPAGAGASRSQRARWEAGRTTIRGQYRQQVWNASVPFRTKLGWFLDLYMPPLSSLGAFAAAALIFNANISGPGFHSLLFLVALGAGLSVAAYLASPFVLMRLPWRFAGALLIAPYYALWRLTVLAGKAPTAWIRTKREQNDD